MKDEGVLFGNDEGQHSIKNQFYQKFQRNRKQNIGKTNQPSPEVMIKLI